MTGSVKMVGRNSWDNLYQLPEQMRNPNWSKRCNGFIHQTTTNRVSFQKSRISLTNSVITRAIGKNLTQSRLYNNLISLQIWIRNNSKLLLIGLDLTKFKLWKSMTQISWACLTSQMLNTTPSWLGKMSKRSNLCKGICFRMSYIGKRTLDVLALKLTRLNAI